MKIVFLPIDNRPVCYQLPEMIAKINNDIELVLPPIEWLGNLTKSSDIENLMSWLSRFADSADAIVLSLDTIAYGGLINSRRSAESFETIKLRLERLKNIIKASNAKVYAFSSVMRISNNNINQEEKEYWNVYGKDIFKYSYECDKYGAAETQVPAEIIADYLATRKRNFNINKLYLEWQREGLFKSLIFSKDDCSEFGFNIREARELSKLGGCVKTGADEIPLVLLSKVVNLPVKIFPIFLEPDYKDLISNYEDISIEQSVLNQIEAADCIAVNSRDEADVLLVVNNFKNHQGEIVMKRDTELYDGIWSEPDKPYIIADVRNANGSDNNFVKKLFEKGLSDLFLGYSGWNTSANTIGSLICEMKYALYAKKNFNFNRKAFLSVQAIRFMDDWAYQANVRQQLSVPNTDDISVRMKPYMVEIKDVLKFDFNVKYSFPWSRLFEVKVELI